MDEHDAAMRLSIGQFSAATHLSVKMLRRYHDMRMLVPADIDEWTGYRFYSPRQIGTAQTIRRLRDLDMPVREIAELLDEPDDGRRHVVLAAHLQRLEHRLEQTRTSIAALRRLLDAESDFVVRRHVVPERVVAAVTATLEDRDVLAWFDGAMTDLAAAVDSVDGPFGAVIDNTIFAEQRGAITLYLPTAAVAATGRVHAARLPAVELATAVHVGNHDDIDVTYGQLAQWLIDRGRPIGETVHETYLVGPRDTPTESAWRTEISRPIG